MASTKIQKKSASAMFASTKAKVSADIVCTWYRSSGTVTTDRMTVYFVRIIAKLVKAGSVETSRIGIMMRRTMLASEKLIALAASICP